MDARPSLLLTHQPGHVFITELEGERGQRGRANLWKRDTGSCCAFLSWAVSRPDRPLRFQAPAKGLLLAAFHRKCDRIFRRFRHIPRCGRAAWRTRPFLWHLMCCSLYHPREIVRPCDSRKEAGRALASIASSPPEASSRSIPMRFRARTWLRCLAVVRAIAVSLGTPGTKALQPASPGVRWIR